MQNTGFQQILDNHDVLGTILRMCSNQDQQRAYKVCRAMRDVCHQNMKTVKTDAACKQVRRLCPRGARSIRSLHVRCCTHDAFVHLEQLLDAQHEHDRSDQNKQLATVTDLCLIFDGFEYTDVPYKFAMKLLDLTPNVKHIKANRITCDVLLEAETKQFSQIEGLTGEVFWPEQLQQLPTKFQSLMNLHIKYVKDVVLPPQLTNLKNLQIDILIRYKVQPDIWAPLSGLTGLTSLAVSVTEGLHHATIPASHLTKLVKLQKLELKRCRVSEPFLLAGMPSITHLTLDCGVFPTVETDDMTTKTQNRRWPVLQRVRFMGSVLESVVRALQLPQPHAGLEVSFDKTVTYRADTEADTKSGFLVVKYLAAAQAQRVVLTEHFAAQALQAMSSQQVPLRYLGVWGDSWNMGISRLQFPKLEELRALYVESDIVPLAAISVGLWEAILRTFPQLSLFQMFEVCASPALENLTAGGRRFVRIGDNGAMAKYRVESIM